MRLSLVAFSLAVPLSLSSQQPSSITAIRAGVMIDGTGAAPVKNAVILVQGERITAVGTNVPVPGGATVIDLSGYTVLPGFIDAHVHLTGRTIGDGDWQHADLVESPAKHALLGAAHAQQTLEAGFTTVRNVGAGAFTELALRDAIAAGWLPGPRILGAGNSFGINGGHCDGSAGYWPGAFPQGRIEDGAADGVEEVREAVRYNVKYGADLIKICATGGVLSPTDSVGVQQYTEEEMRAVVAAAHLLERRVAAHAHGTAGIKAATRAGVTSIEHGSILDAEAVALMKEKGTWLVPTLMAGESVERLAKAGRLPPFIAQKALAIAPRMQASFKMAVDGRVKIALGTDAGVFPHGTNGHEFALMVRYGMRPMQAIQAGTLEAASLLGLERDVGTVAAGKYADLVAVRGDPLQDIGVLERVDFVMKGGAVFKQGGQVVGTSAAGVP
ncbi:MAG TPA: amidohydrolase family protein [Gemmatimonadales bacterium]|nr:amidohydrolase family protein [Gemmatimonadales bacterium]